MPFVLPFLLVLAPELENAGFDARPTKDAPLPGWTLAVGATNGASEPASSIEVDAKEKKSGRASLRLAGDDTTRTWRCAQQDVPVRPGAACELRAWVRTRGVHQETVRGTSIRQFANAHLMLLLLDGSGEVVARDFVRPPLPDSAWTEVALKLEAPDTARTARVVIALTMSGTFWVDDVRLTQEGGRELAPPRALFHDGFEQDTAVPEHWKEELGAQNGDGSKRSRVEVDSRTGSPGSPRSLRFEGDGATIRWYGLASRHPARPGDVLRLTGLAKGEDVRKEGVQFPNLHARLVFLDARGEALGAPRYAAPGTGTFDWTPIEVRAVAPEGTAEVLAGLFLSMSGRAWFDQLELTQEEGGAPAYAGWPTVATAHLDVRHPPGLRSPGDLRRYAEHLDANFERIVQALQVEFPERVTVFLYRDKAQGQALTGRELAYAEPERRAVHQTLDNTPGHELVHVVALKWGTAQTALFGEGLAVWHDGQPFDHHHDEARRLLAEGRLPSLADLLGRFRELEPGYPAAGSFCGFLLDRAGLERFRRLYLSPDPAAAARDVLGESLEQVDAAWREFLAARGK